ncbi:MAG: bifunctional cytidylate kinase/30S ribosomal protein S1 [Treponema sp.]|nr:MAG: bifunctional cytidylate kinase/30S ribosomal protein S1 [Treponema sp.]
MVIAIDGPAGSGKSTIAKKLSEKFNLIFMNTGSFYRALSLAALRHFGDDLDLKDEAALVDFANSVNLSYKGGRIFLDNEDVEYLLRTDSVEEIVSPVSAIVPIRHILNKKIRHSAEGQNIICEGRDMTTVVFPQADLKIYLDASATIRAERRFKQGTSEKSLDEIQKSIEQRDNLDKNKTEGSLKVSPDAFYLDTTGLTISQVCAKITNKIYSKGLLMEQMEVEKDVLNDSGENIQAQLQEEYLNFESPEVGTIMKGRIVAIDESVVFIDVGGKSEGRISRDEFDEIPKIGDTVEVFIEKTEVVGGRLVVSKEKAEKKLLKDRLKDFYENQDPVTGTISKQVKGGFEVLLPGKMSAFLPISQADVQRVDEPESLLGVKSEFLIERFSFDRRTKKENIVVNRRKYLEENVEKNRNAFFNEVEVGQVVKGVVKSFTSFGAFVDLGGFDGLLHINDMSWGHVTRPRDFVKKGQEIELKVIRLDPEDKRINLSLKHFTPDPWLNFESNFQVNDVVKGKVTKITEFGAFIELAEGIEGLAHISEFSWVKKINKPEDVVKSGDEVECMILGYDIQAGRVSLGLKQVTDNPWDTITEKYPVGSRIKGKVVKLTNAGAFVELEEGIDGFLHVDDISWTKRIRYPGSELSVGDEIEAMVIESNSETKRIKLGIKQLSDDPWATFKGTYNQGAFVEGEVTSITDFGVFVKVPGDIEGLIHKQNLVENREDNPDEVLAKYNVGDKVKAVVIDVNPKEKRVAFSIKDYKKKLQQAEISKYMSDEQDNSKEGFTLGDLLKNKPEE